MAVEAAFCLALIFVRLRASSTPPTTTPAAKIPREREMLWVSLKKYVPRLQISATTRAVIGPVNWSPFIWAMAQDWGWWQ